MVAKAVSRLQGFVTTFFPRAQKKYSDLPKRIMIGKGRVGMENASLDKNECIFMLCKAQSVNFSCFLGHLRFKRSISYSVLNI